MSAVPYSSLEEQAIRDLERLQRARARKRQGKEPKRPPKTVAIMTPEFQDQASTSRRTANSTEKRMKEESPLRIVVDSREQLPFPFRSPKYRVEIIRAGLPTGDYSLPGFEAMAALEQKSLDDLVSCLMGSNRDRFERELARGATYHLFGVVIEAALSDITAHKYTSRMEPRAVLESINTFTVRYGTAFIWSGSRAGAEYMTHSLLAKYLREIGLRYKAATTGQSATA